MVGRIVLTKRDLANLECILSGAFAPLQGFMTKTDWQRCCTDMRLANGAFFPLPIVLPVDRPGFNEGDTVTLVTDTNLPVATLSVESVWKPDVLFECEHSLGTTDVAHPYVKHLTHMVAQAPETHYVGGPVHVLQPIPHYDFAALRKDCAETKALFQARGAKTVVGFQTRNPMHRCHFALTRYALKASGDPNALLFLNPAVGPTQPGDVPYPTRVRCYKHVLKRYPQDERHRVILNLLPLAMRMAGPREACLHALMRKNHGCTHFVVGRDHAGPSTKRADGTPFYGPYDAQQLLTQHAATIGITPIYSKMLVYDPRDDVYKTLENMDEPSRGLRLSGTELRRRLKTGENIPEWFSYPEVVRELRLAQQQRGCCVYLIGLSGAGKTTLCQQVATLLRDRLPSHDLTLLDGDQVRHHLSKGLGFSKADRSINVRRVGYVASEVVRHGGIVLCANIAPYARDRAWNRHSMTALGGTYLEVYVDTPLEVCEERDVKGLYAKARAGEIKQFTGISDPFEAPCRPEFCTWQQKNVAERIVTAVIETFAT